MSCAPLLVTHYMLKVIIFGMEIRVCISLPFPLIKFLSFGSMTYSQAVELYKDRGGSLKVGNAAVTLLNLISFRILLEIMPSLFYDLPKHSLIGSIKK